MYAEHRPPATDRHAAAGSPDPGPPADGLKILLVDDDFDMVRQVRTVLAARGFPLWRQVETAAAALEAAAEADIVLLDQQLPDGTGLSVLERIRSTLPDPPAVVIITGHGSEAVAVAALRLGADDYVRKDASLPTLLPQVVERVRRHRAIRQALGAAERDLVEAERLAVVGEMSVTLRHELNNPLMAALAEVELLLQSPAARSPETRTALRAVQDALTRIAATIRRMGDMQTTPSAEYGPGIRMLDLASGSVTAGNRGKALVLVADEDLARLTVRLLHHAGFAVERLRSLDGVTERVNAVRPRVLVTDARQFAPEAAFLERRASDRDRCLLVALANDGAAAARARAADLVVQVPFDPATFAEEILAALPA
ncbi:MAG: response regulator [Gemmatimonadota bacterium]